MPEPYWNLPQLIFTLLLKEQSSKFFDGLKCLLSVYTKYPNSFRCVLLVNKNFIQYKLFHRLVRLDSATIYFDVVAQKTQQ